MLAPVEAGGAEAPDGTVARPCDGLRNLGLELTGVELLVAEEAIELGTAERVAVVVPGLAIFPGAAVHRGLAKDGIGATAITEERQLHLRWAVRTRDAGGLASERSEGGDGNEPPPPSVRVAAYG